jgi:hypothetical protein
MMDLRYAIDVLLGLATLVEAVLLRRAINRKKDA